MKLGENQLFNALIIFLGMCCKNTVEEEKKKKDDNEAYQMNFQKITALKIHNKI